MAVKAQLQVVTVIDFAQFIQSRLTAQPLSITNPQFLEQLLSARPEGSLGWVTSFPMDPGSASRAEWSGYGIDSPGQTPAATEEHPANTYYTVSSFRPDSRGRCARSRAHFDALLCLVLDDLGHVDESPGAKIPLEKLDGRPEPSYVLETSPGCYQVGYILSQPVTDRATAETVIKATIDYLGEKDPGMNGVTRYVRLPEGHNSKLKYRVSPESPPFRCRMIHWEPEQRYSVDELAEAFEVDLALDMDTDLAAMLGVSTRRSKPVASLGSDYDNDPWAALVMEAMGAPGAQIAHKADGDWFDVICPNAAEHTDGDTTGSAYRIGSSALEGNGYACHHGHCQRMTFVDIRKALMSGKYGESVAERARSIYVLSLSPDIPIMERGEQPVTIHGSGTSRQVVPVEVPTAPWVTWDPPKVEERQAAVPPEIFDPDLLLEKIRKLPPSDSHELREALGILVDNHKGISKLREKELLTDIAVQIGSDVAVLREMLKPMKRRQKHKEALSKIEADAGLGDGALAPPAIASWPIPASGKGEDIDELSGMKCRRNLIHMMDKGGVTCRSNAMTGDLEVGGKFDEVGWRKDRTDPKLIVLQEWASATGLERFAKAEMYDYLQAVAMDHVYHPFEQYLDSLTWDGEDRLRGPMGLFQTIPVEMGKETLRNVVLSRWLYSIVAASRNLYEGDPGAQPRGVLTIVGGQAAGKSTSLNLLFKGLYEDSLDVFLGGAHFSGTADSKMELLSHMVVELGELDQTMDRVRNGELKAFISSSFDVIRRPYAVSHERVYRRTVFCATVNEPQFLRDPTGATRFWVLELAGKVALDEIRALDVAQIWAQIDAECMSCVLGEKPSVVDGLLAGDEAVVPWLMSHGDLEVLRETNEEYEVKSNPELWLSQAFLWESEKPQLNACTTNELRSIAPHWVKGSNSQWVDALRKLTGQTGPCRTRRVADNGRPAKVWYLPKPVRGSIDEDQDLPDVPHSEDLH